MTAAEEEGEGFLITDHHDPRFSFYIAAVPTCSSLPSQDIHTLISPLRLSSSGNATSAISSQNNHVSGDRTACKNGVNIRNLAIHPALRVSITESIPTGHGVVSVVCPFCTEYTYEVHVYSGVFVPSTPYHCLVRHIRTASARDFPKTNQTSSHACVVGKANTHSPPSKAGKPAAPSST